MWGPKLHQLRPLGRMRSRRLVAGWDELSHSFSVPGIKYSIEPYGHFRLIRLSLSPFDKELCERHESGCRRAEITTDKWGKHS